MGRSIRIVLGSGPEKRATVGVVERKVEEVMRGVFAVRGGGEGGEEGGGRGGGREGSPPTPPPIPVSGGNNNNNSNNNNMNNMKAGDTVSPMTSRRLRASTHRSSPSLPVHRE